MAGETILVIEDTPVSLKLAAMVLRTEGYRVHIASTAEQALSALRTLRPDLLLVDIMLPGMSGLELAAHVRREPRLEGVPLIALTALTAKEYEDRARLAGFDGYLTKPIDTRTLATRIREFLDGTGKAKPIEPAARESERAAADTIGGPGRSPGSEVQTPLPDAIGKRLAGEWVALVGLAEPEADLLCAALERAAARPRLFDGQEPADSESVRNCSVAVVHVRPETLGLPWLQPEFRPPAAMLVVLAGRHEHILGLDPKVHARASDYLIDSWQPEEALMRLSFARLRAAARSRW
jgi:CheY-like chemotaxis protein